MTITEIIRYYGIEDYTYYNPYIIKSLPSTISTPQWWIDIGGTDISKEEKINITSLLLVPNSQYAKVNSYNDLLTQDASFYFNSITQELFIHLPYNLNIPKVFSYGATQGYSDNDTVIYIDDVLYQPLLKSVPSFAKQADLANYDKLSFLSGSHVFDNSNQDFDFIIDEDIYSNDVFDYYLPTIQGKYDYERSELKALATFYVEDYEFSLSEFVVIAQDKRKSQDINILDNEEIPLIYGTIPSIELKALDDTVESPQFRIGKYLTSTGQVQVEADIGWVNAVPYDINLVDGTFFLSFTDCRKGGVINGTLLPVRTINPIGVINTSALDVIVDINQKILGIEYTASNYDLTTWESARTKINDISAIFDSQQKVFEAIQKIQSGSNIGFRYDITADGKRTILLDDFNRSVDRNIYWTQIKDNMTLSVKTNSELIAGIVNLKYNVDTEQYVNTSKYDEVLLRYRTAPTYELETLINKESDAIQKSNQILDRFSTVPRYVEITLHGIEFYDIDIYNILTIDLSVENGRKYFGKWKVQVLGIAPNTGTLENTISALLLERVTLGDYLILADSLGLIGDINSIIGDKNTVGI